MIRTGALMGRGIRAPVRTACALQRTRSATRTWLQWCAPSAKASGISLATAPARLQAVRGAVPDGDRDPKQHNSHDRLTAAVREVVQREMAAAVLRLSAPERRPTLSDLDAEGEVLCALLNNHCTPSELAPLQPKHFFGRFNSRVAVICWTSDERDPERIADKLAAIGTLGPVAAEIAVLRDSTPLACRPALARQAVRLVELWDRRRLLALLRAVELELVHEVIGADEARRRLGEG